MPYYKVTDAIRKNAEAINVSVKSSQNPLKKLDVYNQDNKKIASIGATGYMDFHLYKISDGENAARKKQKAYRARHRKNIERKYDSKGNLTAGYLADKILWT